jgi:hypothetical protein
VIRLSRCLARVRANSGLLPTPSIFKPPTRFGYACMASGSETRMVGPMDDAVLRRECRPYPGGDRMRAGQSPGSSRPARGTMAVVVQRGQDEGRARIAPKL